jgi:hypothetical protein
VFLYHMAIPSFVEAGAGRHPVQKLYVNSHVFKNGSENLVQAVLRDVRGVRNLQLNSCTVSIDWLCGDNFKGRRRDPSQSTRISDAGSRRPQDAPPRRSRRVGCVNLNPAAFRPRQTQAHVLRGSLVVPTHRRTFSPIIHHFSPRCHPRVRTHHTPHTSRTTCIWTRHSRHLSPRCTRSSRRLPPGLHSHQAPQYIQRAAERCQTNRRIAGIMDSQLHRGGRGADNPRRPRDGIDCHSQAGEAGIGEFLRTSLASLSRASEDVQGEEDRVDRSGLLVQRPQVSSPSRLLR